MNETAPRRGFFEIGIFNCKTPDNLGTLWRSAYQLGAAGIFVIGDRCKPQRSDTQKAFRKIPLRMYRDFDQFIETFPFDCALIGVETGGAPMSGYAHPQRAIYLLGAEDRGLPQEVLHRCQSVISIESLNHDSYNVAVAGSLVMYHRQFNNGKQAQA